MTERATYSDPAQLLTLTEVAELLSVSRRTVERYIEAGELPVVRLMSRNTRVRRSDLDAFINKGTAA